MTKRFYTGSVSSQINTLVDKEKVNPKRFSNLDKSKESPRIKFPTQKQLSDAEHLEVRVFVPSTRSGDIPISKKAFETRIKEVATIMNHYFGGSTVWVARGGFRSKKFQVNEVVAIVSTFTTKRAYGKVDERLKKYLTGKKKNWGQESIAFEFDNSMVFV